MSTIKAIEGRSVHQIQSGQVIVDLCSVVKELVENSLDAGATSIDVRFKNHGLESIDVQDNGAGILPDDYETIALKHYTSKLSSFDELSSLDTFGFRGEALSSLCALSHFHIITARDTEAPKGKRLDFETSGKLKDAVVAACPKGTTVAVEDLFYNLPVRRRELEKNIKREYAKVLNILHAYACVSTGVRLSVSNQMSKGKKVVVFSTNSNPSTKQNISNVFGAKTLLALIPMDLTLELQPSTTTRVHKDANAREDESSRQVRLVGHVSRPVFGEGRQTPDRQMFFVNSRPCALPQVSKAFNEVYKSYNITQSPFIFANLKMNTNAYDVNVSPDKRIILLHDQSALLETLKQSLNQLFEAQDQTVPQSQLLGNNLPSFRPLNVNREPAATPGGLEPAKVLNAGSRPSHLPSSPTEVSNSEVLTSGSSSIPSQSDQPMGLLHKFVERNVKDREQFDVHSIRKELPNPKWHDTTNAPQRHHVSTSAELALEETPSQADTSQIELSLDRPQPVQDFNDRLASQQAKSNNGELEIPTITVASANLSGGVVQSAFDRMRTKRQTEESPTINMGSTFKNAVVETPASKRRRTESPSSAIQSAGARPQFSRFAKRIHVYAAPGAQPDEASQETNDESDLESDQGSASSERQEPSKDNQADSDAKIEAGPEFASDNESDADFIDETERKKRDEARIEEMVRRAEETAARPTQEQKKRANALLKNGSHKDSTLSLLTVLETSVQRIDGQLDELAKSMTALIEKERRKSQTQDPVSSKVSAEERLSLTIAKPDFAKMRIIGQFNLGFILVTRPSNGKTASDDLFIIDQHASDEIYNFSRLSATTTLNPQPLVRPHPLELTAIEEETILNHTETLAKNGFTIAVDESGASQVGQRCHLLTLPTSRETVFDTRDLEELIALLGDSAAPSSTHGGGVVTRPSKVRKMLAMRACRSSIMVGKPLTKSGMRAVVRHMGEIDRPWNCPHGRPTMRHLAGLGEWSSWDEGDGLVDDEDGGAGRDETDWWVYVRGAREEGGLLDGRSVGRAQQRDLAEETDGSEGVLDAEDERDDDDDEDDDDGAESLDDVQEPAADEESA